MNTPHRIEIHGGGIGIADDRLIERRAEELAHMDGRKGAADRDYVAARKELAGASDEPAAPEGNEAIQSWDEAPGTTGSHSARVVPDDEKSPGELLIDEGMIEADHDTRVAAAERDGQA